jgi:hypothetical protein
MELQTGETYNVPCAILLWKEDSRVYFVPVFDLPHTDLAFDFPHRHYHVDGRFEIHPRICHRLKINQGYTLTVILTDGTNEYEFKGIGIFKIKCVRSETGLAVPEGNEKYANWYKSYAGRSCAGKKCPHLGTDMLEINGKLICPLHGLTADQDTLTIIPIENIR